MAPAAIPAWMVWMTVATTVATSVGTAVMQRRAANAAQETAKRNAETAREMARRAREAGQAAESEARIKTGLFVGKQRVAAAGAGAVIDRDSPLLLVEDASAIGELEARKIQAAAAAQVWGYEMKEGQFELSEEMARFQGRLLPASTLLQGAAQLGGAYYNWRGGGLASSDAPLVGQSAPPGSVLTPTGYQPFKP